MWRRTFLAACIALLLPAVCAGAQSVTVDNIVYTIDQEARAAIVADYEGTPVDIVIPPAVEYEGESYPVQEIGSRAFYACSSLKNVILSEGIDAIGSFSFDGCEALVSISLPDGLKFIDACAFAGCLSLSSIVIPDGVEYIDMNAFDCCPLTEVVCHSMAPPAIHKYAFDKITFAVAQLVVPLEAEAAYREDQLWGCFYRFVVNDGIIYAQNTGMQNAALVGYTGNPVDVVVSVSVCIEGIDMPVVAIGNNAFWRCASLKSIVLPERLESIGSGGFQNCSSLEGITIPEGVVEIKGSAFEGCSALVYVSLPSSLQNIGHHTFMDCASLESIAIRDGLMDIGISAFHGCSALANITFPSTLQRIGSSAFGNCISLNNITFPKSLVHIDDRAFSGCPLTSIICLGTTPPDMYERAFDYITYATADLKVPDGAENAYRDDQWWGNFYRFVAVDDVVYDTDMEKGTATVIDYAGSSKNIVVAASVNCEDADYSVTAIGQGAFLGCSSLVNVILPNGLQSIGSTAFAYCDALESIIMPENLQSIGDYAFARCKSLESIAIPNGVSAIRGSTFDDCASLQSVTISQSVTSIGYMAFNRCFSLKDVVVPKGVENIAKMAFSNCISLQSISLPSTLQSIGYMAFESCPLIDIYTYAIIPPVIDRDAFDKETYDIAFLHVPIGTVSDYQIADGWRDFFKIVGDAEEFVGVDVPSVAPLAWYANGVIFAESPATIDVYAPGGARVLRAADATSLSLQGLPRGIYIIGVEAEGRRQMLKVLR